MTDETSIVERLRERGDMIFRAHSQQGRKIERPFTLEDFAIAEIERLQARVKELEEGLREVIERGDEVGNAPAYDAALAKARAFLQSSGGK